MSKHTPIVHLHTPFTVTRLARLVFAALPVEFKHLAMLGGGAIRSLYDGTPVKDYDLFFRSEADYLDAEHLLASNEGFLRELDETGKKARYPTFVHTKTGMHFNLVGFHFSANSEELVQKFDFTCCGFAVVMGADDHVFFTTLDTSIEDAMTRRLVLNQIDTYARTHKRVDHYISDYGYHMEGDLANLMCFPAQFPEVSPRGVQGGGGSGG